MLTQQNLQIAASEDTQYDPLRYFFQTLQYLQVASKGIFLSTEEGW